MIRHLSYTQKRFFFQQIQVSPRTLVISPRASFRVLEIVWNWLNPHGVVMKGFNVIQYMLQVLSVCHLWHVCGMFYVYMRGQVSVVEQIEEGISLALEKMFRYGYYFSLHFCCRLKNDFALALCIAWLDVGSKHIVPCMSISLLVRLIHFNFCSGGHIGKLLVKMAAESL